MKKHLLTLAALSLAASAFAQSNGAASSTKPAAVETIEADDHGLISTQPSIPRSAPAVEALALHHTQNFQPGYFSIFQRLGEDREREPF